MSLYEIDRRPPHDPSTCTREHCGRCNPPAPGPASAPAIPSNPHGVGTPRRPVPRLAVDPDVLAGHMQKALDALRAGGDETWVRFDAWTHSPRIPTFANQPDDEPDEDGKPKRPTRSMEDERDRMLDAQAASYWGELSALVARLDPDLQRLKELVQIANQPRPHTPKALIQGCELCTAAGLKQGKEPIPFDHRGNVAGRLSRDMFLCDGHYRIIYRHGDPTRPGWVPTSEQTRRWYATGTWRVKESLINR